MKGEACFVCADSEIYHCYLLCAGSTCECESERHNSSTAAAARSSRAGPATLHSCILWPWVFPLPWHHCLCCHLLLPPWSPSLPFNAVSIQVSREKASLPVHWLVHGAMLYLCLIQMLTLFFPYVNAHLCLFSTHLWAECWGCSLWTGSWDHKISVLSNAKLSVPN